MPNKSQTILIYLSDNFTHSAPPPDPSQTQVLL